MIKLLPLNSPKYYARGTAILVSLLFLGTFLSFPACSSTKEKQSPTDSMTTKVLKPEYQLSPSGNYILVSDGEGKNTYFSLPDLKNLGFILTNETFDFLKPGNGGLLLWKRGEPIKQLGDDGGVAQIDLFPAIQQLLDADAGVELYPMAWVELDKADPSPLLKVDCTGCKPAKYLAVSVEMADDFAVQIDYSGTWAACFRKFRSSHPETCQIFHVADSSLVLFHQFVGGTSNVAKGKGWMVISDGQEVYRFRNNKMEVVGKGTLRDEWRGEPNMKKALRIRTDSYPNPKQKQVNIALLDVEAGIWEKEVDQILPVDASVIMDREGQLWKIWLDPLASPQVEKLSWNH